MLAKPVGAKNWLNQYKTLASFTWPLHNESQAIFNASDLVNFWHWNNAILNSFNSKVKYLFDCLTLLSR
jgi:hypothetical protein